MPLVLYLVINYIIIAKSLKMRPVDFLRKNFKKAKTRSRFKLKNMSFINKFKLRVIFANKFSYAVSYTHLTLTVGTLFAMVQYSTEIYEPIRQVASVLKELISMQASMDRVNSILEADVDVYDTKEIEAIYGDEMCIRDRLLRRRRKLKDFHTEKHFFCYHLKKRT